jgi:hypothetical protein
MGIESLLLGSARSWSIGVDSGTSGGPAESRFGESDLILGGGKRSAPRFAGRNSSAAESRAVSARPNSRQVPRVRPVTNVGREHRTG